MKDPEIRRRVNKLIKNSETVFKRDIMQQIIHKAVIKGATREEWQQDYFRIEQAIEDEMYLKNYVLDRKRDAFVHIPQLSDKKAWIIKEKIGESYYTQLPVEYVYTHLEYENRRMVDDPYCSPERTQRILKALDSVHPMRISPIYITYFLKEKLFGATDGIHRIQVFHSLDIPYINSYLDLENSCLYVEG